MNRMPQLIGCALLAPILVCLTLSGCGGEKQTYEAEVNWLSDLFAKSGADQDTQVNLDSHRIAYSSNAKAVLDLDFVVQPESAPKNRHYRVVLEKKDDGKWYFVRLYGLREDGTAVRMSVGPIGPRRAYSGHTELAIDENPPPTCRLMVEGSMTDSGKKIEEW